jgi:8-oxo-dGTP pyrophosphatase MutT (NUDIX family)
MISGAARELFEELGVLVAHGGEALTKGQRASLLDDLDSGRISWPALLKHYELYLDANDFTFVGRWVTPPFNARRFDTWFFLVNCPPKQEPYLTTGELQAGEWITASDAYDRWMCDQVVAVPPTLHALRTLASVSVRISSTGFCLSIMRMARSHGASRFALITSAFPCARQRVRPRHTPAVT